MIVYRELSSLCNALGYSAKALYTASNSIYRHYHKVELPKKNGGKRILYVPDIFLKSIQKSIVKNILAYEEISIYATAYHVGGSTKKNAEPHVGADTILKMDIKHFFDHITYAMVKNRVFTAEKYSEANRILLSVLCVRSECTPQGAPTSPYISNIIMKDFDNRIGEWCTKHNIKYTRYCDDMTFSGNFNPGNVIKYVTEELMKEGFFVNDKKTVVIHNGKRKEITGIVVNEKISIPNSYKKNLRQEIYYCKKYGIESHLHKRNLSETAGEYHKKLLGKVNYILSVEKNNEEFKGYREWLENMN